MRTIAVVLLAFSVTAFAAEPASKPTAPKITVGKDTTHATGPLRADGTVDYVASLNQRTSAGVTPETNAAVALLRVFGPEKLQYDDSRIKRLWPALGIEPIAQAGDYYIPPEEFAAGNAPPDRDAEEFKHSLSEFYTRPWTAADAPLLRKWLESQDKNIDRIAGASRLPRMYSPFLPDANSTVIGSVNGLTLSISRLAANALTCRAGNRLAAGDLEGFRSDVDACRRLARLVRQRPALIDHLVAIGIDAIGVATVTGAAASERLTSAQARTLLADLDQVTPIPPPAEAIDLGERYIMLDFITLAAREGWVKAGHVLSGKGQDRVVFAGKQNKDWDAVLRRINKRYDRIVDALSRKTFAERQAAMDAIDRDLEEEKAKVGGPLAFLMPVEDRMMMILTPSLSRTVTVAQRVVTERDLARVALALAAHKADRGEYPKTLGEVVPAYLPKLPRDEFAAAAPEFTYARNEFGGYRLTSVGPNGKDERQRLDENFSADDVVVKAGKQPEPPKVTDENLEIERQIPFEK